MTIEHHLSDDILLAYSAGALPEAFALMVATHLSLCDTCRAQAEAYDALGGAVLEEDAATPVAPDALERVLAGLDSAEATPAPAPAQRQPCDVLPAPLQDYVGGTIDAVKWRPVGMGVRQSILKTGPGGTARLLFIPAGAAVPDHGHRGTELTMVLKGAFADESERFARGDVESADETVEHTPIADVGSDCICLAVTDAPLRFNGLIPRLIQPFLNI